MLSEHLHVRFHISVHFSSHIYVSSHTSSKERSAYAWLRPNAVTLSTQSLARCVRICALARRLGRSYRSKSPARPIDDTVLLFVRPLIIIARKVLAESVRTREILVGDAHCPISPDPRRKVRRHVQSRRGGSVCKPPGTLDSLQSGWTVPHAERRIVDVYIWEKLPDKIIVWRTRWSNGLRLGPTGVRGSDVDHVRQYGRLPRVIVSRWLIVLGFSAIRSTDAPNRSLEVVGCRRETKVRISEEAWWQAMAIAV